MFWRIKLINWNGNYLWLRLIIKIFEVDSFTRLKTQILSPENSSSNTVEKMTAFRARNLCSTVSFHVTSKRIKDLSENHKLSTNQLYYWTTPSTSATRSLVCQINWTSSNNHIPVISGIYFPRGTGSKFR